jgi:hypothetical protein
MSRFDQKYHKKLIDEPKPDRYRNTQVLYKEKLLLKPEGFRRFITQDQYRKQIVIVLSGLILGLLFMMLSLLSARRSFYFLMGVIIAFGPFLFLIVWLIGYSILVKVRCRKIIRNREDVELEEFVSNSPSIQKYNKYHIKAIRETLGFIYSVSPKIIYLSDTGKTLGSLGCILEPYGFEVILGIKRRLGINPVDCEIDRIIARIHDNAHNVEELTAILCEEISTAEETQGFKDSGIREPEENIKTNDGRKWLLLAGLTSVGCGLSRMSEMLKKDEDIFTFSAITSILVIMAIGFVVVYIIGIVIRRWEHYFGNKKPEDSDILDELVELADKSSVKNYIYNLALDMYHKHDFSINLEKYQPLPLFDDFGAEEVPWFAEVSNRLKRLAGIEEIPFATPKTGVIALVIDKQPFNLNVELCDGIKEGYIKLSLEQNKNC